MGSSSQKLNSSFLTGGWIHFLMQVRNDGQEMLIETIDLPLRSPTHPWNPRAYLSIRPSSFELRFDFQYRATIVLCIGYMQSE